ncbi:MAG: ATP-grasp domain-containing protein, partial [Pseudomonadota bacterium]
LIKAVDEVGGRGIEFFDNEIDMTARAVERMQTENPPPLLQEQTPGEDYCLTVLYKEGELLAHMAYHNIQTMPSDGAAGAMRETIDDTPFLEIANKLMAEINWTGVAEIDFMWTGDPKDTPHLIEVNPRFWAGLFQSVESGIDFPWLVYHLYAYGFVPDVNEAVVGTKTRIPVAWAAGALSEAFSEDIDMEGAQKAWREMLSDVKDGELNNAAHSLKTAFAKITNFEGAIDLLRSQSRHAQEAKSELMIKDDPLSSLGVFFVLSSLIRHGKLPPEIKS